MPADVLQITARLDRTDPSTPWGFRMQGGKDFSRPITIQRVTPGSLADKCGLKAGDTIVKISDLDTTDTLHKDAQHAIVTAGNYLELILQRGGGVARDLPNVYTMYDRAGGPARTYSPTPDSYGSTSMSPQLSRMNLNTKPQPYQPYQEDPQQFGGPQSKSFQRLMTALDTGEEMPTAYSPAPEKKRPDSRPNSGTWSQGSQGSVSPKTSPKMTRKNQQYNSPAGLYSNANATEAYEKSFRRSESDNVVDAPPRPSSPKQHLDPPPADWNRAPSPKSFPKFARPVVEINSKPKPFVPSEQVKYEPTRIDDSARFNRAPAVEERRYQPTSLNFKTTDGRSSPVEEYHLLPGNEVRERLAPMQSPMYDQKLPSPASSSIKSPLVDKPPSSSIKSPLVDKPASSSVKSPLVDKPPPSSIKSPLGDKPPSVIDRSPLGDKPHSMVDRSPLIDSKSQSRFLDENENKEPLHSRSFKILQQQLDSNTYGQEPLPPAMALRQQQEHNPNKDQAKQSNPVKQYNTPIGLYSSENAQAAVSASVIGQQRHVTKDGEEVVTVSYKVDPERPKEPLPEYDEHGRRIYRPQMSDTFKLIHERQKSGDSDKGSDKSVERFGREKTGPTQGRTMKFLQQHLDGGSVPSEPAFKAPPTAPTNQQAAWSPSPSGNFSKPAQKWQPVANSPATARSQAPPRGVPSRVGPPPSGGKAIRGRKGEAVFSQPVGGTARIPICSQCGTPIRGPFVLALGKSFCPDHFKCANCNEKLIDIGFVEENGKLYCERDYEMYFAPQCNKCHQAIVGDCVHALSQKYHPHCFVCTHCRQPIGSAGFHMEDSNPYCERDWAALYQTKCASCEFPIEPGDLWLEALGNHYHSGCFNCATCQVSLEGQSYFAKGGRAYCSKHAGGRF